MAQRQPKHVTDQLRRAIEGSGLTRYRIAKDAGIDESTLAKFYHGKAGFRWTTWTDFVNTSDYGW